VQNINPAGGLVIGAFHVFGSILENDVEYFRTVRFDEVEWTSLNVSTVDSYRKIYENLLESLEGENRTSEVPWYLDELFGDDLLIERSESFRC